MSRGPNSQKAIDGALPLAALQGTVYVLQPGRECPADFEIVGVQGVIFVAVKMTRCLHASLADIGFRYSDAIFRLRAVPISPSVFRELWLCSRNGRWRFFEIRSKGLVEIALAGPGGVA